MIDLEDSATPDNKELARERVLDALADRDYFGGRHVIVRVNNLPQRGARTTCVHSPARPATSSSATRRWRPRKRSREVRSLLADAAGARSARDDRDRAGDDRAGPHRVLRRGRGPALRLRRLRRGRRFPAVRRSGDDLWAPANHYARTKIAVAAAAYGLFCTGGTLIPQYKDLARSRSFVQQWADLGYTACIAVSPAHLDDGQRGHVAEPRADRSGAAGVQGI